MKWLQVAQEQVPEVVRNSADAPGAPGDSVHTHSSSSSTQAAGQGSPSSAPLAFSPAAPVDAGGRAQVGARILVDAEHSWLQGAIDLAALRLQARHNRASAPVVYNTFQCYRRDSHARCPPICRAARPHVQRALLPALLRFG